jgi:NAD(P)-dependent dehydrogenase (short-subunit alcohol dehydrogenase family)
MVPRILALAGGLDIFHANAGIYVGGDLVDAEHAAIDRMLQLNVAVVMKNVRDVLQHMVAQRGGDIIVTSSLAAHFPTPWEPVYASSKWAIDCFVQTVRRQVFKHGIRVGGDIARPGDQRAAGGLAGRQARGSQGLRQPARPRRSGAGGAVHAHAPARHDHPRRGHAAHPLRSVMAVSQSHPPTGPAVSRKVFLTS